MRPRSSTDRSPGRAVRARVLGLALFLLAPVPVPAQVPDTALSPTVPAPAIDTLAQGGIDTVVEYSAADSVVFLIPTTTMSLHSRSRLRYRTMSLEAGRVGIDWSTATLTATGDPGRDDGGAGIPGGELPPGDSLAPGGEGVPWSGPEPPAATGSSDSIRGPAGLPVLIESGERYDGRELSYNFRTRQGRIELGETKIEEGFYRGETIKKIDDGELFVRDGRYTTCDLPDPHYYFGSPRMKVGIRDRVIAEPVYLYVSDVPVFGLPFAVLPNRAGRRSGIIAPAFGDDARRGKFLSHLGFYWAASDHMDASLRSDLYTKGGWALYGEYRYALRYRFTGSVTGDYKNLFTGESADPKRTEERSYRLNLTHSQEFDPTTRLGVNFTFTSANSLVNTLNLAQALNQNIVSNATLSRSWEGTPNSVSINVGRTQDLRTGNVSETLPSLNFNHSQSFPLRGEGPAENRSWYEEIAIGYGAGFTNRLAASDRSVSGVKDASGTASTVTARQRDRNRTLSQSLSLNVAPKLGHLSISPSVSYRDVRSFIDNDVPGLDPADSTLRVSKVTASPKSGVVTAALGASTKLYGFARPPIPGVSALRHTMSPSLSFSWSRPVIGEDKGREAMAMNLGVGNLFEIKTAVPDTGEPEKIQLLNLNASTSYLFSADSLRLAPLSLSFRTGIRNVLDVDGGATYDFYQLLETAPGKFVRVNRYLISEQGRLARLTSIRFSLSTKISGGGGGGGSAGQGIPGLPPGAAVPAGAGLPPGAGFPVNPAEYEPDFSIPWSLSLTFAYAENKVQPATSRSANLRGGLEFSLTEKWKVTMSGGYDVQGRELVAPDVTISRDLHCWFMNFYWVPTGAYRQYRFEIRVKASSLSDLKVTKQGSDRGFAQ